MLVVKIIFKIRVDVRNNFFYHKRLPSLCVDQRNGGSCPLQAGPACVENGSVENSHIKPLLPRR